ALFTYEEVLGQVFVVDGRTAAFALGPQAVGQLAPRPLAFFRLRTDRNILGPSAKDIAELAQRYVPLCMCTAPSSGHISTCIMHYRVKSGLLQGVVKCVPQAAASRHRQDGGNEKRIRRWGCSDASSARSEPRNPSFGVQPGRKPEAPYYVEGSL